MTHMMSCITFVTLALGVAIAEAKAGASITVNDVVEQLRRAANYSWRTTTENRQIDYTRIDKRGKFDSAPYLCLGLRTGFDAP
jgi:hypothetical protein